MRVLPRRRRDAPLPAPDRPRRGAAPARRGLRQGEPALARARRRADVLAHRRARPRRRSSRASPGRGGRRTACRSRARSSAFLDALATFGVDYTNGDEGVADTFPASDPTAEQAPGAEPEPCTRAPVAVAAPPSTARRARRGRRRGVRARARLRRDRGDHVLHEHVQPAGDGRRRAAREERRRARPDAQAVGQDEPRARLEGRDRVLRARRPDRVPRRARLQHRRLRLHDLHRELGPAAGGDLRRRSPRATSSSAPSSRATATSRRGSIPR